MSDDTTDVAVDQDSIEQPEKFEPSEEQKQYFGSWMGRKVKEHTESLRSEIGELKQLLAQKNEPTGDELTEKILNGGAKEVFQQLLKEEKQKEITLKAAQEKDLQKAMTGFSEDPLYKDVYVDAHKLAKDAMSKGYPVGPATELAMAKAKEQFLMSRDPDYSLKMTGSGKPQPRQKKKELPSHMKAAAQRDIADGIFKDEAEYIDSLTPDIRARHGL